MTHLKPALWEIKHFQRWNAALHVGKLLGVNPHGAGWPDKFAKMLGCSNWKHLRKLQQEDNKTLENQLTLLTGPHALTILKAIQARSGCPHLSTDS